MDTLYVVVPCFNEEEVLPESARIMRQKLRSLIDSGKIAKTSRILLVDDGSADSTWKIISELYEENELICGLRLSKNRGHQNALMAGLISAVKYADFTISIDADLQDDIDAIDEMVDKYNAGAGIVCGVRRSRDSDSFLKRFTARGFYAIMSLCGGKTIFDHADFRLMSAEAVRRLSCFGTQDLFLRGLITRLELPIEKVRYDRLPRMAGESKYSLKKMLLLAKSGFDSRKVCPASEPVIEEFFIDRELIH